MTVEELIEALKALPPTAMVFIETTDEEDDFTLGSITDVIYDQGRVSIRFDE